MTFSHDYLESYFLILKQLGRMIFQGTENTLFEIFQPPLNNHCCSRHLYIINGQTKK